MSVPYAAIALDVILTYAEEEDGPTWYVCCITGDPEEFQLFEGDEREVIEMTHTLDNVAKRHIGEDIVEHFRAMA